MGYLFSGFIFLAFESGLERKSVGENNSSSNYFGVLVACYDNMCVNITPASTAVSSTQHTHGHICVHIMFKHVSERSFEGKRFISCTDICKVFLPSTEGNTGTSIKMLSCLCDNVIMGNGY